MHAVRGAGREAGGPGAGSGANGMHGERLTQGLGNKACTRGAHVEHLVHGRDAGGVKAQRLVEGRRALPSRGEGMRCGGERCETGRREGLWCGGGATSGMHGEKARLKAWGPRARAERTRNMLLMSVTLEVSKLSGWLKAFAICRVEGRACDAGGEVRAGRREGLGCGGGTQESCTGEMPDSRLGGQGHARSARRTCSPCP
jgi:hypothetical protein